MREHVVTLGGGHGLAAVVRALRKHHLDVTVIVTVADDGGSSEALHRRWGRLAVGDMRRSLIALTGESDLPGRRASRPRDTQRLRGAPVGQSRPLLAHQGVRRSRVPPAGG